MEYLVIMYLLCDNFFCVIAILLARTKSLLLKVPFIIGDCICEFKAYISCNEVAYYIYIDHVFVVHCINMKCSSNNKHV